MQSITHGRIQFFKNTTVLIAVSVISHLEKLEKYFKEFILQIISDAK